MPGALTCAAQEATPGYLLSEGFEGPGFENSGWFKIGAPNEDYTGAALHGGESLYCSDVQFISRRFVMTNRFNLYFRVRWNAWGDFNNVIFWYDSAFVITARITVNPINGVVRLDHGSVIGRSTTPVKLNTTYHMWVEWTKGQGADGTMNLYFSTDGIKPALPAVSINTGNGSATDSINIGPTTPGQKVIFDRILASDLPIGDSPAPSISEIADQTIAQDSFSNPIPFTVGEIDTVPDTLLVTGSSSNPILVPNENIVFGGSGSNRTVTVVPASGQSGNAMLSILVSDGSLTATNNFSVNVMSTSNPTLMVTANDASRSYGASNPDLSGTITGLQEGDDISAIYSTTASEFSSVGNYAITITLNDPQGKLTNYTVIIHEGTLNITPAPLTVNVDNQTRLYGSPNPPLTGTIAGLQEGDDISAIYSTTAKESSSVGNYSITSTFNDPQSKLTNYRVITHDGTLNITPAPLTVTVDNQTRLYGSPNPPLTGTIEGLQNGDDIAAIYSTGVNQSSSIGNYAITISLNDPQGRLTNYTVVTQEGTLNITSAPLTVTVDNQTRLYGAPNPPFTGGITGLKNGDDIAAIYSTSANEMSSVGEYPITVSLNDPQGKLTNYTVTTHDGILDITPAPLTVTVDNQMRLYGAPNPSFTGTIRGLQDSDDIGASYSTVATTLSPVGTYEISCSLNDPAARLTNYAVTTVFGTLTVVPAGITSIQFLENNAKLVGTGAPGVSYSIQATSNLADWQEIGTATADPNGVLEFEDLDAANFSSRFYRAISPGS